MMGREGRLKGWGGGGDLGVCIVLYVGGVGGGVCEDCGACVFWRSGRGGSCAWGRCIDGFLSDMEMVVLSRLIHSLSNFPLPTRKTKAQGARHRRRRRSNTEEGEKGQVS
jgi:hypothetical protein